MCVPWLGTLAYANRRNAPRRVGYAPCTSPRSPNHTSRMRLPLSALALAALAALAPASYAQSIVTDLATMPTSGDTQPFAFHALGAQTLFFAAGDDAFRLWSSDGTAAGTTQLREWPFVFAGVSANAFVEMNGELYFTVVDSDIGNELWKTDGTALGTVLVKDIYGGSGSSIPISVDSLGEHLVMGGFVYFMARDLNTGFELWRTDGTGLGTQLVKDLELGPASSLPSDGLIWGGALYFFASDGPDNKALYKTDGSSAGTSLVFSYTWPLGPGTLASTHPGNPVLFGGKLFFRASHSATGQELWTSDGTTAGTSLFMDLNPTGDSDPILLSAIGNVLYFTATQDGSTRTLFRTDGTPAGTFEIYPGSINAVVETSPGIASFTTPPFVNPGGIWSTDGTVAGTHLQLPQSAPVILNLNVGPTFTAFTTFDPSFPSGTATLWQTDLTTATKLVELPAITAINQASFANGGLWFQGTTTAEGTEPWRTDGTQAGTQMVANLTPDTTADSNPKGAITVQDKAYFFVGSDVGPELFVTDGSAAGTQSIAPLPGSFFFLLDGAALQGKLVFCGIPFNELWVSDGTPTGTHLAVDLAALPIPLQSAQAFWSALGKVFFLGRTPKGDNALYVTDGTAPGTLPLGPSTFAGKAIEAGGLAYLGLNNPLTGYEPSTTDGTATGTKLLADLEPGPESSSPKLFTAFASEVYFAATTSLDGAVIWRTSGPSSAPSIFFDLLPGKGQGESVLGIAATDTSLYFMTHRENLPILPGSGYEELWVSDGTAAGTSLLKTVPSPAQDGFTTGGEMLTATASRVYFFAGDGLWTSDGSAGSTVFLHAFPGWNSSSFYPKYGSRLQAGMSDSIVFYAHESATGAELWVSDGTPAGTYPVTESLNPGVESTDPDFIVRRGNQVLFSGNDPMFGRELIQLLLTDSGGFVFQTFGAACAGPSGLASAMNLTGTPLLGGNISVGIQDAPASQPAFLFCSASTAPSAAGSCSFLIASPQTVIATATSPTGSATLPFAIPLSPALLGAETYAQWVVLDAGTLATSNALELVIGQ